MLPPSIVLVLVVVLVLDFLGRGKGTNCQQGSKIEKEDEDPTSPRLRWASWGRLGRELRPTIAGMVWIEAIDQSGQHCHDTGEHFLTGLNTIERDEALSDGRIEAGGALEWRATGVIEKLGASVRPNVYLLASLLNRRRSQLARRSLGEVGSSVFDRC